MVNLYLPLAFLLRLRHANLEIHDSDNKEMQLAYEDYDIMYYVIYMQLTTKSSAIIKITIMVWRYSDLKSMQHISCLVVGLRKCLPFWQCFFQ